MMNANNEAPTKVAEDGGDSDRFRRAALKRGAQRSAKFRDSIEDAIRAIAQEMAGNSGIYPHNGGNVSVKEVVRRAGVNEATVYKKYNDEIKKRIELWLQTLKKKETVGRMRVRRSYQERAEDWRLKYLALETTHIATSLKCQQLQAEANKLKAENEGLLAEIGRQAAAKVVPFGSKELR